MTSTPPPSKPPSSWPQPTPLPENFSQSTSAAQAMPAIPPDTRVVILAGGKGTRLQPYTTVLPKPLMPIGDRPILEIVIEWIRQAGLRRITISVGHLAELIRSFFGNGEKWGVEIEYAVEDTPLGTIGPLALIDGLGEQFIVLNGDVLTDLDLRALYHDHAQSGAALTVATCRREVPIDFGVLRYDPESRVVRAFEEKPVIRYDVSMGVYVLSRRCLGYIPPRQHFGFDNLILTLLERGEMVRSFVHGGRWLDIGRPADFDLANQNARERTASA